MSNLYTTEATATGGRQGTTASADGRLNVTLSTPQELGGDGGPGTNPEQLFAAGYAACFQSALGVVARRQKIDLDPAATITARVGLLRQGLGFGLDVELEGRFPGLSRDEAQALMAAAHEVCPYSAATRGNVDVRMILAE
jgi:Ohr subfamily peroxiredoxin